MLVDNLCALASATWVLKKEDGSPYLTRYVLAGADCLENHDPSAPLHVFVHRIHCPDTDRHLHSHPWAWSVGVVLSGGYTERRACGGWPDVERTYRVGDMNILRPGDYHSIVAVLPDTVTLFMVGREISDWGFLVGGVHVPHREYLARAGVPHMAVRGLA